MSALATLKRPSKHRWGVISEGEYLHLVPVDGDGDLIAGHELRLDCQCRPEQDPNDDRVVIHEAIQ